MAIYNDYFGFSQNPFSITPNPAFLYLSPSHQDALGHLVYGVGQGGGFVALTGEVGTGKTTLIRSLLEQSLENVEVALCLNPQLTATEFVANICDELGVQYENQQSLKTLIDSLNAYLLRAHAEGKRVVVIIDEAQQLSRDVLEEIRLLTNLETTHEKLLRIILVGQPELQAMLARKDLRQLSQRITARSHISPLTAKDTAAYVRHRLRVAGAHPDLFSAAALKRIWQYSQGIPRLINVLCERALMGAYAAEQRKVGVKVVNQAAAESLGTRAERGQLRPKLAVLALALVAAGLGWWFAKPMLPAESPENLAVAEPPPATATAPALLSFDLADAPAESDRLAQALGLLWQPVSADTRRKDLCQKLYPQLQCLNAEGDWRLLQLIDRPALLTLAEAGKPIEVLLLNSNGQKVTLKHRGRELVLPIAELLDLWTGQFTLIFKNTSGKPIIEPDVTHASVQWLRQRMGMADGKPVLSGAGASVYDAELQARVRAFQSLYGLSPDGWVGAQTLALLDNLAPAEDSPRLMMFEGPR